MHILPGRPTGKPDQMSPIRAAVPVLIADGVHGAFPSPEQDTEWPAGERITPRHISNESHPTPSGTDDLLSGHRRKPDRPHGPGGHVVYRTPHSRSGMKGVTPGPKEPRLAASLRLATHH